MIALYTEEHTTPNKPLVSVKAESIPEELRVRAQWVVWKAAGEKPDKVQSSPLPEPCSLCGRVLEVIRVG